MTTCRDEADARRGAAGADLPRLRSGLSRRRFLGFGIVAALGFSAVVAAGCTQSLPAPARQLVSTLSGAKSPITLGWYDYPDTRIQVTKLVDAFNNQSSGVAVTAVFKGTFGAYIESLRAQTASGGAADVGVMSFADFITFAKNDSLLNLDPYLQGDNVDKGEWLPLAVANCQWRKGSIFLGEGNIFGLPWDWVTHPILFYNVDLFDKAGLSRPDSASWTWEMLRDTARRLTVGRDGGAQWGVIPTLDSYFGPYVFTWMAGGSIISDDFRRAQCVSDPVRKALEYEHGLMFDSKVAPQHTADGGLEFFAQGKAAMAFGPQWNVVNYREQLSFKWDLLPLPKGPAGKASSTVMGGQICLFTASQSRDAAWEFLMWLCTAPGQTIAAGHDFIPPSIASVAQDYYQRPSPPHRAEVFRQLQQDPHLPYFFTDWANLDSRFNGDVLTYWQEMRSLEVMMNGLNPAVQQLLDNAWKSV
jgi:multiple sugar transport system substrate-binding protein